ncbi:MAG: PLP-dependent aminotransferase family protein [Anaerolineales bacterium]|nr:PLP-dependent aminotransferase family protein [Anaerolineales bacterium]
MAHLFANRLQNTQKSFIREILKVTQDPEVISFAGGLPNPQFFPVEELAAATAKALADHGRQMLQYSTTEGHAPLREFIAARYAAKGVPVSADEILITNGSQQGLDLIGKVFLNQGDAMIIERPGYLGAIQAFAMYEPEFLPVPLLDDGIDLDSLETTLHHHHPKLFYAVPNFQNPSGVTYSEPVRRATAHLLTRRDTIFVEDNPYGELRFAGNELPSMRNYLGDQTILLGSFSKVVAPGLRLGWICAKPEFMDKFIIAKQATDLHSNYLAQCIVAQFLQDNDLDAHLATIKAAYKKQCDLMVEMMVEHFPEEVTFIRPEGGMFIWVTLPEEMSSLALFEEAARLKVVFVPGRPFYVGDGGDNTLRLNFSNCDEARIETGIAHLAEAMKALLVRGNALQPV